MISVLYLGAVLITGDVAQIRAHEEVRRIYLGDDVQAEWNRRYTI